MAASSRPSSDVGWSKWQIALAVGAPIAVAGLAFGAYYLSRSGKPKESTETKPSEGKKSAGKTSESGEGDAGKNSVEQVAIAATNCPSGSGEDADSVPPRQLDEA